MDKNTYVLVSTCQVPVSVRPMGSIFLLPQLLHCWGLMSSVSRSCSCVSPVSSAQHVSYVTAHPVNGNTWSSASSERGRPRLECWHRLPVEYSTLFTNRVSRWSWLIWELKGRLVFAGTAQIIVPRDQHTMKRLSVFMVPTAGMS